MKKAPACPSCGQPLPLEVRTAGIDSVLCPSCGVRLKRGPRRTGAMPAVPPAAPPPAPVLDLTAMAERVENSALVGLGSGDDATRPDGDVMPRQARNPSPPPAATRPAPQAQRPPPATPPAPSFPTPPQVRAQPAPLHAPPAAAPPAPSLQPLAQARAQPAPPSAAAPPAPSFQPLAASRAQHAAASLQPLAQVRAQPAPLHAQPPAAAPAEPFPQAPDRPLFDLLPESQPPSEISPAPAIEVPMDALEALEMEERSGPWWRGRAFLGMSALVVGPVLLLVAAKLAIGWPGQAAPAPAASTAPAASATGPRAPAPSAATPSVPGQSAPVPGAPPPAATSPIGQVRQPLLHPPAEPEPEPPPPPAGEAPPAPAEAPPPAPAVEPPIEGPRSARALATRDDRRARQERHRRRTVAAAAAAVPAGAAREAYQRGSALLLAGESAAAVEAYREAIARDPQEPAGYRGLGLAHAERGERTEALRHLKRYLKMAPRAPDHRLIERRIRHLSRKS